MDPPTSPASPMPPGSTPGNARTASNSPASRTRPALTSLLLSLAPLVAVGLIRGLAVGAGSLPGAVVTVLSAVVYVASFISSLGAVLIGRRALGQATPQSPPPQPALRAAAVAGIVLGIVGMALLILGGVLIAVFLHSCSVNPANCG